MDCGIYACHYHTNQFIPGYIPKKKSHISKSVKKKLWNKYFKTIDGECFCCKTKIDSFNFEAGHVVAKAKGGDNSISNLRCICSTCNKSMGTHNLELWKKRAISRTLLIFVNIL